MRKINLTLWSAVIGLGCILLLPAPPVAIADDTLDYTEYSLQDLMEMNVVTGASRIKQKAKEAPASITIITQEDIKTYGYRTLAEVLASLRGFSVTYDRNYFYIGVRGLGDPGDLSSRVLVLVDGIRTNDGSVGGVMTGNGFPVDLGLIERIEVIRGPASSLYGTNAILGIINVITKEGYKLNGVEMQAGMSSFGGHSVRVSGGFETESGLDVLLSGTLGRVDGQDHYIAEFDDPYYNNGVFEDGDSEEWNNFLAKAIYKGLTMEVIHGWRYKQNPMAPGFVLFNDNSAMTKDTQWSISTRFQHELPWDVDFSTQVVYQYFKWDGEWPYDFDFEGNWLDYVDPYIEYFWGKKLTGTIDMTKRLPGDHVLAVGAEYVNNMQMDMGAFDMDPYYEWYNYRQSPENWGLYALTELHLYEGVLLNLALRHDQYTTFGGSTNPRLALVTEPLEGTVFKALYGTAFRAPNGYEISYEEGQGTLEYTPEEISTFELILEQTLGRGFSASVSAYQYDYKTLNDEDSSQEDLPPEEWVNDEVESIGLEFEVVRQARHGTRGRLSYSYNDAKDRLYNPFMGDSKASPHMVKLNVSQPILGQGTRVGFEMQYNSKRLTINRGWADHHYLLNLNVMNTSLIEGVELQGGIFNLLNVPVTHPATWGEASYNQDLISQDGRSFRVYMTLTN